MFSLNLPETITKPWFPDIFRGIKKEHWKENIKANFLVI